MESFTGAEIAALITEGCAIASADVFSRALEAQLASNPLMRLRALWSTLLSLWSLR